MNVDDIALSLARFAHGMKLEDVPPAVRERARHLMLDALGCGLAARGQDYAARLSDTVFDLGQETQGQAAVIGFGRRLAARDAALLNGLLCHGLDFDDTHMAGIAHLSVSVLPATMALGGRLDASGEHLLAAYIVGLECGARIAKCVRGGLTAQGFHPSAVVGAFASTLAAGRLMELDEAQLMSAQGIALSLASGPLEFLQTGAWTKRIHPGWAAQSGITAATMGKHRIPAPPAPYQGRFGLYSTFLSTELRAAVEPALAVAGLDQLSDPSAWELMDIAVKPYPMCHFAHAAIEGATRFHDQDIDPAQVARIDVFVPEGVVPTICEPEADKRRPQTDYDAKFSLPYSIACGLVLGRLGLEELRPERFSDPRLVAVMDKTHYTVDAESTFPRHYSSHVQLTMADGTTRMERVPINPGHAERPLPGERIVAKYRANATLHFGEAHAQAVLDAVMNLERHTVREMEALLGQEPK
ncbi:MmgE/PrpD family protein [Caballeronia sp. LZ065]|uniref:MmgE/PrpD family protein n=1 Tax=Caballeronia sp. LZ065 TaxID=3038571 RepID=UPI00285DE198|nr:MmgE/PrpD family protein [Caballeronia sp. LZ065]MDR5784626.1 MmgE/PrpD family protein [Caballeronia sp. LZ065]